MFVIQHISCHSIFDIFNPHQISKAHPKGNVILNIGFPSHMFELSVRQSANRRVVLPPIQLLRFPNPLKHDNAAVCYH